MFPVLHRRLSISQSEKKVTEELLLSIHSCLSHDLIQNYGLVEKVVVCTSEIRQLSSVHCGVKWKVHDKLHASGQPVAMLKAVHNGPGAFKATSEEAGGLDPVICIAQDAKVMLCANLWVDVGLVNGARGTIVAICYENGHSPPDLPVAVMVRFDCYSGPTLSDGSVPICPLRRTWFASNNQCSRLQVPLKLAWAVTIHKSQGMTLDKAVIDVGRKEFSSGLTFVACSRVRRLCDLLFVPPFPFQRVANLSKSNRLKDRLQEDVRLSCLTTTMPVHDSNITTTLASGPLPSLNTTEHPSSTTVPSITDLPIGQQATGQEQQQPAFIPNNAPEVPNDGAASVPKSSDYANNCAVFIPNNAPEVPNDGAATVPKSSDCANDCAVPHIQAAGDEEVMIVPSSGSFTCPFQYNPVDREWQQETCEAMGLNYITSNGITPVGLEPPTTFTRIVGMVTVCFVPWHTSSLDQKSSTWMYVVALSVTCEQSEICLWEAMSEKVTLTHISIPVVSSMIMNGARMLRS